MKIAGILLIILLGWLVGRELKCRIKARHILLCEIDMLCDRMIALMRFERLPLDRIIHRMKGKSAGFIRMCADKIESGSDFHAAWEYSTNHSPDLRCLKPEEREDLRGLGQSLGRSDLEGEISLIEGYRSRLAPLREAAAEEIKTKGRALQSCCLLAGIFLAIVMI